MQDLRGFIVQWLKQQLGGEGRSAAEIHRAVQAAGHKVEYVRVRRTLEHMVLSGDLDRLQVKRGYRMPPHE